MNYQTAFLAAFLASIACVAMASPESKKLAEEYRHSLSTGDGSSRSQALGFFTRDVPNSIKADVLSDLLETTENDEAAKIYITSGVLGYLSGGTSQGVIWNERLKQAVVSCKDSKSESVRYTIEDLTSHFDPDVGNDLLRHYLKDSNEGIREVALMRFAYRPNGRAEIRTYLNSIAKSSGHDASLERARSILASPPP